MGACVVCLLIAAIPASAQSTGARQNGRPPADLAAVERSLESAARANPSASAWEKVGLVRHLQNNFAEAVPAFREALRLNPSLWTSHLFLGICLYRTNQFEAALKSLTAADRLAPAKTPGRDELDYWLGATHIALGNPLRGLQAIERLLARNPGHVEGLELAARTYADVSTMQWNQVAETHFDTPAGLEVHGHALESEGNRKGAIEAFRSAKEMDPKRAGPGLALGRLLLLEGRAEEALQLLQQETSLADADPQAFHYAGLAAAQLARYADAGRWLQQAAKWPERNPEAQVALAEVYLAMGELTAAIAAGRQAVTANPSSQAAHELLLSALRRAGMEQEALAEQKRWSDRQ